MSGPLLRKMMYMCVVFIALIAAGDSLNRPISNDAVDITGKIGAQYDEVVRPVPYGHIYKEGFGDIGGLKSPIDFLDLNIRHPMDSEEARELLKTTKPENIIFYSRFANAMGYTNPRDRALKELGVPAPGPEINETQFKWYDLAEIQRRNVPKHLFRGPQRRVEKVPSNEKPLPIFKKGSLTSGFLADKESYLTSTNFTTCDEFRGPANFVPKDIVNFQWLPFYVWSPEKHDTARIHIFKYATKKLVRSVRELYRKFIKIDWEKPKLVYKGIGEFLLVAVDRRGLFHALQIIDEPPSKVVQAVPYSQLRLKVVEPYLVVLHCTDFYATIMAVVGNGPETDKEKEEEANTVGIRGPGWPVSRDIAEEKLDAKILRDFERAREHSKSKNVDEIPRLDELQGVPQLPGSL